VQPADHITSPSVAVFAQTIMVAGFEIVDFDRFEHHAVCHCTRSDQFDCKIRYLFCITDRDSFPLEVIHEWEREANSTGSALVFVATQAAAGVLSWNQFVESLGGAVPSWRALSATYANDLHILSRNQLPAGVAGEAWFLFEQAVADGFEFILGRRVRRLGGLKRGKDVPDSICLTPDSAVLVLDAKASATEFSITKPELRPLEDYVRSQATKQTGQPRLGAAILIAQRFLQEREKLVDECARFQADTSTPLCLLTVESLLQLVSLSADHPTMRNAVSWRQVFCRNGIANPKMLKDELLRAKDVRMSRGD
jgi:hypothetical protein